MGRPFRRLCRWDRRATRWYVGDTPQRMSTQLETYRHGWENVHMDGENIPTAALRRDLAQILIRVQGGEIIHITHYNRPTAVLVPPDIWARAQHALTTVEGTGH